MEEILRSTVHNDNKSSYKLELKRSSSNTLYVVIEQKVYSGMYEQKDLIKFRTSSLASIIQVLTDIQNEIPKYITVKKSRLNPVNRQELIRRYLNKGLEIETLAVQFDSSVDEIKRILISEGVVITSNKIPVEKPRKLWRRKKKSGR